MLGRTALMLGPGFESRSREQLLLTFVCFPSGLRKYFTILLRLDSVQIPYFLILILAAVVGRGVAVHINLLTPNVNYSGRTAPLTSKGCILYIYSTNIATEYFKHGMYSPFFFSSKCSLFHNSNVFGSCIIHILYTGVLKLKKIIPAPKG